MNLSLIEIQTISELADFLYPFLPGNSHPFADRSISFVGIASDLGLERFWTRGSKRPAIAALLEGTLSQAKNKFCPLMIQIVTRGLKYRGKSNPITKEEIEQLNEFINKLDFKIPELWNPNFLRSLPSIKPEEDKVATAKKETLKNTLPLLLNELLNLNKLAPQERGYAFEKFLNILFNTFDMKARSPFRLVGEQIDGSIEFEGNTYLIEAKWQNALVGIADLLVLHGKVVGKATWSRGIFISYSDFTQEGLEAFSKGRPTNLIAVTGQDLYFILKGGMPLDQMIRLKARLAAEEGRVYISVQELLFINYK
ncbi:MAG: restriction endonuclease [Bacteroidales bacterium]|nr:restriction endonuclease [Bacteroidales bacterium]